jgi:hypothetical protein
MAAVEREFNGLVIKLKFLCLFITKEDFKGQLLAFREPINFYVYKHPYFDAFYLLIQAPLSYLQKFLLLLFDCFPTLLNYPINILSKA